MKYLLFLAIKSQGKKATGFTLVELLVVVIVLGVLTAVGLPNLLQQVAKGRQAEAQAILGQINRAQVAYRLENPTFANLTQLPISGINNARYYSFSDYDVVPTNATRSSYRAQALDPFRNDIKNYAGGVRLINGRFFTLICEAITPLQDSVFVDGSGACSSDSIGFNNDSQGTNQPSQGGPM
ncbi:type IV pilin-like G/H family protein [Microcystis aeruginosa]|nr:type IV pilin-like G/H family protein [Microcystis aeruginosa]GCL57114.1 pilin polypeptide PilA [Microcystis aeruginosa NIES-3807]